MRFLPSEFGETCLFRCLLRSRRAQTLGLLGLQIGHRTFQLVERALGAAFCLGTRGALSV